MGKMKSVNLTRCEIMVRKGNATAEDVYEELESENMSIFFYKQKLKQLRAKKEKASANYTEAMQEIAQIELTLSKAEEKLHKIEESIASIEAQEKIVRMKLSKANAETI